MSKKVLIPVGVLALAIIAVVVIWLQFGMPQTTAGDKSIAVDVVLADGSTETFNYDTDLEFLGEVLTNEELIEGEMGEWGIFVTAVNGVVVDDSKEQWWCLTKGGEDVMTSFDTTPIADGDTFEITLKEGY